MTQEEKAKRYDEALKRASNLHKDAVEMENSMTTKTCEIIFPELVESEDERIRKEFIEMLRNWALEHFITKERFSERMAWLEKQGEPLEINPTEFDLQLNRLLVQFESLTKEELANSLSFYLNVVQNNGIYKDEEKPIEQKPADKVEPKFHEGDWTVSNLDKEARQISEVHFDEYNSYYVVNGKSVNLEEYDRLHHLWTIQNAKDGDVLYSPCCKLLWVYKDGNSCYIGSNLNYNDNCVVVNSPICIPTDVVPATKEQRDLLFSKMKEARYEWDENKKELKIIDFSKHLKYNPDAPSIIEHKPAWSEEDEEILDSALYLIQNSITNGAIKSFVECPLSIWLKSLKERVQSQNTWEPSEGQMKILFKYAEQNNYDGSVLTSLYQDLKKLRRK